MEATIKTKINKLLLLLTYMLSGAAVLYSCAPATQITGTWKSPQISTQTYNSVVVAALTDNVQVRQTIEDNLQRELQERGIKATKSIDIFPPALMREEGTNADLLMERITGDGHDAILTVAVVDEQTETRYVPGNTTYTPATRFGWYGSFRGYYTYLRPTLYDPGYYTEDKVYFLETNLYNAKNDQLLWSAQSKSYSPSSINSFSDQFAEVTVERMQQENVLP